MLDVATEDFSYIKYPIRVQQPLGCFSSESYTNSPSSITQELEDPINFHLRMESSFPIEAENGVEPDEERSSWSVFQTQQLPWNPQGNYPSVQTPTQYLHNQQQQQSSDLSLLYESFDHTRPLQQSPVLLQNASEDSHSQSLASAANSFDANGTYSNPSTLTSQLSTVSSQGCLCSMLGQSCTCSRQASRPRFTRLQRSFNSTSSSSTNGMADSNNSHSSLVMSPVLLHRPSMLKTSPSQYALELSSMSSGWIPTGRSVPAYSKYPHPINNQLSSQMSALNYSPDDSPSTQQAQFSSPVISYLYEAAIPPVEVVSAASQYENNCSKGPSNDLEVSLPGLKTEGAGAIIVPELHSSTSRSGYRSADNGLPRWSSRPSISSSMTSYPLNHSISQMAPTSNGHFHPYSQNRPLSSTSAALGLTSYNGYEQQDARANNNISTSKSSSTSNSKSLEEHEASSSSIDYFTSEEERWNAIMNRTHSADAHFVYGALTTRIYCRPSCASKRPDRNRVAFFSFPDAPVKAEYAGFRACKRCKPRTPGTADVCVLAVGQCLKHITQAALLGESEEIESRLKRRTLKEYSSDYGVSAFHFHRTLKNVSTLTPGDYSKACHALVLQDEIGMDRKDGQKLTAAELQQRLRGWSSRRARRAVGNILPSIYSHGFPNLKMYYIYAPETRFGKVCILYSKREEALFDIDTIGHPLDTNSSTHCTIMATLIGEDALMRVQKRAPQAVGVPSQVEWLRSLVQDLDRKGLREVQMPQEVIPWVRRARVWFAVKSAMEPRSRGSGEKKSNSEGDDEEEGDDEGDEGGSSPIKKH